MKGLTAFFGNLFTGGKGVDVVRLDLRGGGPAERPRPAPPDPGMAAGHEQPVPEAAYKKGDVIGGTYEVHSLLGKGGFGEVYLVYDRRLREALALKTFRQKFLAVAEVRENFRREALLWVNLEEHSFIVAARIVEEFYGRLFVGMDYIAADNRGRVSLADHLVCAGGPLGTDQALLWAIMFCHGMEHANQRGIKCHRDIKPANILIRRDLTLLISDFGLAAAAEAAWDRRADSWEGAREEGSVGFSLLQTQGRRVCGTPGYLAPEVFRGEGADVRSDVYSFGMVLWQMAAGSQVPPFAAGVAPPRSPGDIDRYALEVYERQMRKRAPAVGEPLQEIIDRCLAVEPSRRFTSFTQLRTELEPILHRRTGQIVKLPPVGERAAAFWNNKGVSLTALGRDDGAITCFKKALDIEPDNAVMRSNLGNALEAKGDLDGAIAEHRTAIHFQPDFADAHVNLGNALKAKGDLEGAIAEYRTVLRLQPDLAAAHNNLGIALQAKGDLKGAIAELRTALRLQTDDGAAHLSLGNALKAKGDLDGAIAEHRAALHLHPNFTAAHLNLGKELQAKGDLEGAIAEYRTVLRLQPDDAEAHKDLGTALTAKGDLGGAIAELRTALHFHPDLADAHLNLGTALKSKGDLEGAIAEYRTVLHLQPDDAEAHYNLGIVLANRGDLDGAIAEWRTAISLKPDLAAAHNNLGIVLKNKGDLDGAIAELRTALRLQPDFADAHYSLGKVLQAKGDLEGAIAEYRTVLRLQPNDVEGHNSLGIVLADRGDLDGAIAEWRTVLRLRPGTAGAHHNLNIALRMKGDRGAARRNSR
ncbi:MAG: tetratricopeptide repeat protein [Terriglobia bacterium]